jgi:hypothetical protein
MPSDSFQLAARRARQAYSIDDWVSLRAHERAEAIYRELRLIDANEAAAKPVRRRRSERLAEGETAGPS